MLLQNLFTVAERPIELPPPRAPDSVTADAFTAGDVHVLPGDAYEGWFNRLFRGVNRLFLTRRYL